MSDPAALEALAERVEKAGGPNNALDVQCAIALFEPCQAFASIRANAAGTKIIYTDHDGLNRTYLADDYTFGAAARRETAAALRARAATLTSEATHG